MSGPPPALRALVETAGALIRQSATGRVLVGRAAGLLGPDGYPAEMRGVPEALARAREQASTELDAKHVKRAPGKLDAEPVAVTPMGAVHRGELDGETVAVRIRRGGLDTAMRNDLALLEALAPAISRVLAEMDSGAVLRAIRERSLDELDFEHEAATQRQVARSVRRVEGIRVAAADTGASSHDALVTEWVDGPTLAGEKPRDGGRVARALVQAHVRAALDGFALVDCRPNHVVLGSGGTVLLGAGNAAAVDKARAAHFLEALGALREDDRDAFVAAVSGRLALLGEKAAATAFDLMRGLLGELVEGEARLDEPALAAMGERTLARLGDLVALAAVLTPDPHDLWLGRMAAQLVATLARLEATEDWVSVARAA